MKYVMPFINMTNWEKYEDKPYNKRCDLCKQIDNKLNHILDKINR